EFDLRRVPCADSGMSAMEIWCNEAQERYVLAINKENLTSFVRIAERERCPYAVIGHTTQELQLRLADSLLNEDPVNVPLSLLFGNTPKLHKEYLPKKVRRKPLPEYEDLAECVERVLRFPTVASKSFLITIGDRSVTGLVARDQMVGPWQV